MQTLLENLPGMVYRCRIDAHWTVLYASESTYDLTGYTASDLLSSRITYEALIHPDDRARVREVVMTEIGRGAPYQLTYRIVARGGELRWVWERGQRVEDETDGPVLEGYITDVTHQHVLERDLQRATRRETLGRLAGGFLHDLSNMVLPLSANLDLLDAMVDDPDAASCVRESLALCDRIAALANQARALLQLPQPEREDCTPRPVLERFTPLLRRLLTPQHTLTLDLDDLSPLTHIPLASTRLEQITLNLVINALEASPQGCAIRIKGSDDADRVALVFSDTGPGIAPEHLPRLFDASFTTRPGGTGLGLYYTAHSVAEAGGAIAVASAPPAQPTTFTLTFPTLAPQTARGLVLIVEPNRALRQLAERHFKQHHDHVLSVSSLEAAQTSLDAAHPSDLHSIVLGALDPSAPVDRLIARLRARYPDVKVARLSDWAIVPPSA